MIAKVFGKRHDNVMADIRNYLETLNIPALKFQGCYMGDNGKELPCYILPLNLALGVVAGYSPPRGCQLKSELAGNPA